MSQSRNAAMEASVAPGSACPRGRKGADRRMCTSHRWTVIGMILPPNRGLPMSNLDALPKLNRRTFLGAGLAMGGAVLLGGDRQATTSAKGLVLEEATVVDLQAGLEAGRWTSADLVRRYQARIRALDQAGPKVNTV